MVRRKLGEKLEGKQKKEAKRDPRAKRPDLDRADENLLKGDSERIKKTLRRQTHKNLNRYCANSKRHCFRTNWTQTTRTRRRLWHKRRVQKRYSLFNSRAQSSHRSFSRKRKIGLEKTKTYSINCS